ncbi:MAG: serine/threonine-protein kinase [Candidatus Dormibacteria bacterium]
MMDSLAVGSTVRETYTILQKLGEGAFSEVFLVRHRFLGLQAMKVFKSNSLSPTSDQFKEAFILSRIAHPNIVRIFEANKINASGAERSYVTMEHAAGGTLHSFLLSRPQLSAQAALRIQRQICAGLAAAHSQKPPIIHRDVKPQNILLTEMESEVTVKVADFGLAKNIDPKLRMVSAAGTLLYMPPEGFHHYETPASDVYSAGIIFYELLTGTFPFPSVNYTTEQEFRVGLARTRTLLPAPPSQIVRGIDAACDEVCLRSLQPDLKKRFQTGSEFLTALASLEMPTGKCERSNDATDHSGSAMKAQKAIEIGKQYAELSTAIQLLEEALREAPTLSHQYGEVLAKWKSGVVL